ncbi:hypothetical protein [Paenirhodobacter sp. CAU 1674]|uniref:hypothetical protein n=1 Tax=Paenirhodobacter sp. CAU 1674 TaxID=3032596 RepID=UPI0023DBE2A5|nr:hypothetical protein [Paenirhodobacter sp. CAU 1674]MDF2141723.1 hypothetical protein [Paenirhodobacter sp. CAU 1674]
MTESLFMTPRSPTGNWQELSANECGWIEFIRVVSGGTDPKITPARVRALRELLDAG